MVRFVHSVVRNCSPLWQENFLVRNLPLRRKCLPISLALVLFMVMLTTWPNIPETIPLSGRFQTATNDPMGLGNRLLAIDWLSPSPVLADLELDEADDSSAAPVSYAVHAFYYAWYNAPEQGRAPTSTRHWVHWNHPRLRHWLARVASGYSNEAHKPPEDIASGYYPKLGPYVSADERLIRAHLRMLRFAGIGVLVLSWYPAGMADDVGEPVDNLVIPILNLAEKYGIKVCLHIEPYRNRTVHSVWENLRYAVQRNYTNHAAYYKLLMGQNDPSQRQLPVFFVYDSYGIPYDQWKRLLLPSGDLSIRGKPEDAYVIGLLIDSIDCRTFGASGFNGGYTYFVGRSTTFASTPNNWAMMSRECRRAGIHFYPSIGPGYNDLSVRPWNERSTVDRDDGAHLQRLFTKVRTCRASGVGITSFNEWHEGTQIEPAATSTKAAYMDYSPFSEEFYLRLIRTFVNRYVNYNGLPRAFHLTTQSELDAINQVLLNFPFDQNS